MLLIEMVRKCLEDSSLRTPHLEQNINPVIWDTKPRARITGGGSICAGITTILRVVKMAARVRLSGFIRILGMCVTTALRSGGLKMGVAAIYLQKIEVL